MGKDMVLKISGMHCEHCVAAVKQALENLPEIAKADVNLKKAEARIRLNGDLNEEKTRQAIQEAGFELVGWS